MVCHCYSYSADCSGLPLLLGALGVDQHKLEDSAEDQLDPSRPGYQAKNDQCELQPDTRRPILPKTKTKMGFPPLESNVKLTCFKMLMADSVTYWNSILKQHK